VGKSIYSITDTISSMQYKQCSQCKEMKPVSEFYIRNGIISSSCKSCDIKRVTEWRYRTGRVKPMSENKECASYLGVHIAEKVLSKVFKDVQLMSPNHPGYDFICNNGYKIDVKSSTRHFGSHSSDAWRFYFRHNTTPDYFLLIAFDNREDLNPEHLWLIPESVINGKSALSIFESNLERMEQYEKPIDSVITCCNKLKTTS